LTKKILDKDKKDWEKFINSSEQLDNKDKHETNKFFSHAQKSIDLHGYTLDEANQKILQFIENCFFQGVNKINIITGKGLRSKNLNDPYQSKDLSILKYSVPDYIKRNSEIMKKISKIDLDSVNSPTKGSFDIYLKKNKNKK
tara:strand:+ start:175 stop:600 length:426 start_codon:yes stop_codon:yes gene_type:complete